MSIEINLNTMLSQGKDENISEIIDVLESISLVLGESTVKYSINRYLNKRGRLVVHRNALISLIKSCTIADYE